MGLVLGASVAMSTGCGPVGTEAGVGTVRGELPLCYGPGPDTNLVPRVVVEAVGAEGYVLHQRFDSSEAHRFYELTLRGGRYQLTAINAENGGFITREPITVLVKAGEQVRANFPSPGCI